MKHAILITANDNAFVVRTALSLLDDERFTFFLLIDKKSKINDSEFVPFLKKSKCIMLPRIVVNWGGFTQINAELELIKYAMNYDCFDYYHYLQNADLPLKTPEYIDSFFSSQNGMEFIDLQPWNYDFAKYKVLCRHLFVDNRFYRSNKILHILNHILAKVQYIFVDKKREFFHASALFSITNNFAKYVCDNQQMIRKKYRYSLAGDEVFLCTLLMNSQYQNNISPNGAARLIDWKNREGNSPHTFTMADKDKIIKAIENPSIMFSRKFTAKVDKKIVKMVFELLKKA